jgi:hypothetical protein
MYIKVEIHPIPLKTASPKYGTSSPTTNPIRMKISERVVIDRSNNDPEGEQNQIRIE